MPYYIRIRGKTFGPFSEEQLKGMRVTGKLSPTTEVSENKTDWQPLSELISLFQPLSTSSEITSPDSMVHSLMLSASPDTNISCFHIKLPFIAICTFFLLIITVLGLIGFIFLTKDNSLVTSKESKKQSQEEQQITEKSEQKQEETVDDEWEQNNTLSSDENETK